jgi:glycosyltransferase involved in cell wall biosynthesis
MSKLKKIPCDFDKDVYLILNPDIKKQYANNPEYHYQNYGYFEKRPYKVELPNDFNGELYLKLNQDVKEQFSSNPEFHYIQHGYFEKRQYSIEKNSIIYILCYDENTLNFAREFYSKYTWAKPILMKYQNYEFENAFWKQLYEIKEEWENYQMVGTLSYSCHKKINLEKVDEIINKKYYFPYSYYNFFDTNNPIPNLNTWKHPDFDNIWNDLLANLHLLNTTENCCNYWMCKPKLMKNFIYWYLNICLPELIKHPLIFENAMYNNNEYDNGLQVNKLEKLWGKPFYPNFPFICERINKCFFVSYYKVVFLISHEKSDTGAVNALLNVKYFYEKNNIKTVLLYLPDIIHDNINVISFIQEFCAENDCSPIVICNTLCSYQIVRQLSNTNIITYWYIHEWFEPNGYYNYINDNHDLFNSNINPIFICKKSYDNLKNYIPNIKNEVIIYNRIPLEILDSKKNQLPEKFIYKSEKDLFILIVGTVVERKNQQKFIDDVFYKLLHKYPNVKLIIVGKKISNVNIKENCKDAIIFTDNVNNAIPYIVMCDIVVSYSINEVLPLSILESFYCSKVVVSSNVGGTSEIIENGVNGLLFKVNDKKTCFQYLCDLIENKELRRFIGLNAYKTYLEKYSENISREQFLLLLSKPNL